jgi:spoIIIJ-associated protein
MDREESIAFAKKYIEDILSFFGLNTDVRAGADEDVIEVSIPSTHLNAFLIGQHGETLRDLQHIVSMALRSKDAELVRINIDVADYKRQRNDRLVGQVEGWIKQVREGSEVLHLKPMSPAERRVVHQAVSDYGDVETHSEGEGRDRHIVLARVIDDREK